MTTPLSSPAEQVTFLRTEEVALELVVPSPHQPRKQMDPLVIQALVESIQAVGVMQRPRAREVDGRFELVFGHQRAEACRQLGYERLAIDVIACDDLTARRMTLHENIKSTRLHPIEHAEGICKFLDATLAADSSYGLITGDTPQARVHQVLTLLTRPLPDGEEATPARQWVFARGEFIRQVIREMANKEPKAFLTSDVTLLQLPDEIILATVEHNLKKGHARALGELMTKQPEMYQELMSRGEVPSAPGEDAAWTPLDQAPVGAIRNLYKPKKFDSEREMDSYETYIPVGVPGSPMNAMANEGAGFGAAAAGDLPPWEDDDEAPMPIHSLPLASLADAHAAITTLSPEEWAALVREASEGAKNDARRHWTNLRRWAEDVMEALG